MEETLIKLLIILPQLIVMSYLDIRDRRVSNAFFVLLAFIVLGNFIFLGFTEIYPFRYLVISLGAVLGILTYETVFGGADFKFIVLTMLLFPTLQSIIFVVSSLILIILIMIKKDLYLKIPYLPVHSIAIIVSVLITL